jgi:hypothetical protein
MKKVFVLFLIGLLFLLVSCKQADNRTKLDYTAFLALLEKNGIHYYEEVSDADSFLSVERKPIWIGDDTINVYEYESNDEMEADASCIDKNGFSINVPGRNVKISWVSNPYFYKKDLIIVNYVGVNEHILAFLSESFGDSFAGHAG